MSQTHDALSRDLAPVVTRLSAEFKDVHPESIVSRCVTAARNGAEDVVGYATPELVERIARQHLKVLALALAEQR
ncbi:hypothetical protein JCM3263A_27720 [Thermobifida fusca]|jgi:hypothetical protein|uniref:Uncharacterized protein n=2 Tax=Thermobifida fusca TaxID=2021 RepID=A0A9P2TD85_THEFU|nr:MULTISPECIES: hypothetical protein [Thermobifida]AAZ54062.1 hypothetical protein Tfu_0022 [Thermobifida fusca YX]EOR72882.1 hypothetical protein TM51_00430 [Thermobifida fusca TM51]MBO2528502.1 hypothetical protein [Thermobifida sp.]MDD6792499.1 hypothetical protein [Thermobifida fusca]PPS94226.1 hypothetical protein BH05_06140 [Thermobifida fusca]